jgi:hypothetical protein
MVDIFIRAMEQFIPKVLAADSIINDPLGGPVTDAQAVVDFINRLQAIVLGAAGAIAVGMIIWGAIILGTAGGNEEKVGKGKKILTYAIGGLIFILAAGFLIGAFIRLIGGKVS